MSFPKKGTRSIVVIKAAYRWRVDYDGLHWVRGYLTPLTFLVQSAQGGGQMLRATLYCSRQQCDRAGEVPFAPRFVRGLILVARASGWRPLEGERPPFEVGAFCSEDLDALKHGWIFSSRDPQTRGEWLTVVEEDGAANRFGTLEARVTAAIGQALARRTGAECLPASRKPDGIRLLCARPPTAEGMRLLAPLKTLCASYDLALCVRTSAILSCCPDRRCQAIDWNGPSEKHVTLSHGSAMRRVAAEQTAQTLADVRRTRLPVAVEIQS